MKHYRIDSFLLAALLVFGSAAASEAGPPLCNGEPNGIVDGNEQCETGPCCTAKCELESAATVCRASTDGTCDPAEVCGTQSPAAIAACPADVSAPDGTACNDGAFCTEGDTCMGGACTAGPATTCDDDNDCTADTCLENNNTCQYSQSANGTVCNDGSVCTTGDVCTNGQCTGDAATVCQDDNACTTDSCDPQTGDCVFTNNSAPCDDGQFCTAGDVCSGGSCTGGPASGCDDGDGCTTDLCNEADDSCTHETAPNGTACEDGQFCTIGETCTAGECQGGTANACNDGNDCTKDACNENANGCSHSPSNNNGPCFDGSLCTTDDVCRNGVCEGGPAKVCQDGNPCTDDACSLVTGSCVFTNNSAPCIDGLFCTTGDTCVDGSCQAVPTACDDGNACTTDGCDEALDTCTNENNTNACEDGLFCTEGDACSNGLCVPGPAKDCGDENFCTTDLCNETTGACQNDDNTLACDDGNACTTGDVCAGGACTGVPKDCADTNVCTTDSCDTTTGDCQNENNTIACEDGLFCTAGDACEGGACVPGPANSCDDAEVCTTDSCNETTDACEHASNALDCDDGLYCTVDDACSGGLCSGSPRDCADENPCSSDACNEIDDTCDHLDNTEPCDDGVFCNGPDTCADGTCSVHPGDPCDGADGDGDCSEACDEEAGACTGNDADDSPCSDGDSCTVSDVCDDGVCESGTVEDPECVPTTTTTTIEPATTTTLEPATTTTTAEPATTTTAEPATTTTLEPVTTTTMEPATTTTVEPATTTTVEIETTTTTIPCVVCGNYNDDDCILTATDALGVLQAAVGLHGCSLAVCDFNGDAAITAIDALGVLRAAVGLPATPKCPEESASAARLATPAMS